MVVKRASWLIPAVNDPSDKPNQVKRQQRLSTTVHSKLDHDKGRREQRISWFADVSSDAGPCSM